MSIEKRDKLNSGYVKEDKVTALAKAKEDGNADLVVQAEESLLATTLMQLRGMVQEGGGGTNPHAVEIMVEGGEFVKEDLVECLKDQFDSEEFLEKAAVVLLQELEIQKKNPGLYIVDSQTGRSVVKAEEDTIFQPPDYVDEQGITHTPGKIVHPKITSTLGIYRHEVAKRTQRIRQAIEAIERSPLAQARYEHFMNPDSIATHAREELIRNDIEVGELDDSYEVEMMAVGKENIESDHQAANPRFHKAHLYGKLLARKILDKFNGIEMCELGKVSEKTNSKFRWYSVSVKVKTHRALT